MSAPKASGCCKYGDAKVLSTTSFAPPSCAIRAIAAMSAMPSSGLLGVSHHTTVVFGVIAPNERVEVGQVDRRVRHAPLAEHLVDQPEGAAVRVARYHHVVVWRAQRAQDAVLGRQPARERQPARAAVEIRQAGFEGRPRRIARPAVLPAVAGTADGVLVKCRDLKDGRDDGPGPWVRRLTGVNGPGLEALRGVVAPGVTAGGVAAADVVCHDAEAIPQPLSWPSIRGGGAVPHHPPSGSTRRPAAPVVRHHPSSRTTRRPAPPAVPSQRRSLWPGASDRSRRLHSPMRAS